MDMYTPPLDDHSKDRCPPAAGHDLLNRGATTEKGLRDDGKGGEEKGRLTDKGQDKGSGYVGDEEEGVTMDAEETGEGGEVAEDPQPLTQLKLLKKAAPTQGGREADAGAQEGDRNPGKLDGEVYEGMLTQWDILKSLFLGDSCNVFNKISRLTMMWNVHHQWPGNAQFYFNCYRHSVQLLVRLPGEVDT